MNWEKAFRKQLVAFSESAQRFPLTLLLGLTGAVLGTRLVYSDDTFREPYLFAGVLACWLGISFTLTATLISEALELKPWKRRLGEAAALLLTLAAFAILRPTFDKDTELSENVTGLRFILWMTASHALVAMTPLLARYDSLRFRLFNISLFQRALATGALSALMFVGLVLAVASRSLFGWQNQDGSIFGALWFWVVGVFSTSYLVGQIPRWWQDDLPPYPAFVKVLTRFILRPLAWIYLIILYAYAARILWLREWPEGMVSALILAFALLGLLLQLLSDEQDEKSEWFSLKGRFFYAVLTPLVALLFAAIWRRHSEYGLTEARALVWLAAFWLGGVVLYFLLKSKPRLEILPLTLAVVTFAASIGPWSIFELSLDSQQARLRHALEKSGRLKDGKLRLPALPAAKVSQDLEGEVSSLLHYFESRAAMERLRPWFASADDACLDCWSLSGPVPGAEAVATQLGMNWNPWAHLIGVDSGTASGKAHGTPIEKVEVFSVANNATFFQVAGFDEILPSVALWQNGEYGPVRLDGRSVKISLVDNVVRVQDEEGSAGEGDLNPVARYLRQLPRSVNKRELSLEAMRIDFKGPHARYRLQIKSLSFLKNENVVGNLEAALLIQAD